MPPITLPETFKADDSGILAPLPVEEAVNAPVLRGPNIKEFPESKPVGDTLTTNVVLKVGDNITTDHTSQAAK